MLLLRGKRAENGRVREVCINLVGSGEKGLWDKGTKDSKECLNRERGSLRECVCVCGGGGVMIRVIEGNQETTLHLIKEGV